MILVLITLSGAAKACIPVHRVNLLTLCSLQAKVPSSPMQQAQPEIEEDGDGAGSQVE